MARSRIRKVADEFEEALQASIACISTSVLVSRRDEPGKPHRLLLTPPARVVSAAGVLEIRIAYSYNVALDVQAATGHRIVTAGYFYDIAGIVHHAGEQERRNEILAYHWNPKSTSGEPQHPHLHIYRSERIEGLHLSKMHLPTGQVTVEAFLRLLISEFDVAVLRDNWAQILGDDEAALGPD